MNKTLMIEVGAGELIDRISILHIKSAQIKDQEQLANVRRELDSLGAVRDQSLAQSPALSELTEQLSEINTRLWQLEDDIRACEANRDFGAEFIAAARGIYLTNDRRATIKRDINFLTGSSIIEEKLYAGGE